MLYLPQITLQSKEELFLLVQNIQMILKSRFVHRLKGKWLCGIREEVCTDLSCNLLKVKILTFYLKSTNRTHKVIKAEYSMLWA